ncbi:heparinase II/III family protein [Promicromonospora sp. NPDC019610]|uniref:heparinase II/III domain-containing protein n=1 Tax=Promicromonospora sp. NPDC019610 TaxID=3364405 RepID=UPI0037BA6929
MTDTDLGPAALDAAGGAGAPPRLLLDDARLADLRSRLDGDLAPRWRRLAEQCDLYRRTAPPTEHPLASITYLGPAAANLALAYRLTGQRHYLEEAWRWISAAVSFEHWGRAHLPDHDLDAGWLLHGLSLAYTWLGDDLGPERSRLLRAKLALQGERLYDFAVANEGSWWSSSYWQNHHWICHTGLATVGYALGERAWTERAKDAFATVVDVLPADGSDMEGVVYWRYGVPWLATYLDLLQHAEGVDWWDRCRFLAHTFWYRLHQAAPGYEEIVDHGDCHDRRSGHSVALYRILAARYGIGEAQWLADTVADRFFWREAYESGVRPGVLPEAWAELLWYDAAVEPVDPATTVSPQAAFEDLGLLVHRTSWGDDATLLSFKSSPGGGRTAWETSRRLDAERGWDTLSAGHHHPDAGSFVLASRGAWLLVDEGYSNRKRAGHHNLVLVDGQGFAGEGRYHVYADAPPTRTADMVDVLAEGGFLHGRARTGRMYPEELGVESLERTVAVLPSGRVVVVDRGRAAQPRSWTLLFHADHPAEEVAPGPDDAGAVRHVLRNGRAGAWLTTYAPGAAGATSVERVVTDVEANPTSSTPDLVVTRRMHTLRVTPPAARDLLAVTVIEPFDAFRTGRATGAGGASGPVARLLPARAGVAVDLGAGERAYLAGPEGEIDAEGVRVQARAVLAAGEVTRVLGADT